MKDEIERIFEFDENIANSLYEKNLSYESCSDEFLIGEFDFDYQISYKDINCKEDNYDNFNSEFPTGELDLELDCIVSDQVSLKESDFCNGEEYDSDCSYELLFKDLKLDSFRNEQGNQQKKIGKFAEEEDLQSLQNFCHIDDITYSKQSQKVLEPNKNNIEFLEQPEKMEEEYPDNTLKQSSKIKSLLPKESVSLEIQEKNFLEAVRIIRMDETIYFFNGKYYEPLNGERAIELYRSKVSKSIHGCSTLAQINHLYPYLRANRDIREKNMDTDLFKEAIVFENGVYDLLQDRFLPHNKKYIVLSGINCDYVNDPNPSKFLRFLHQVTNGEDLLQERMLEMMAYLFMQSNDGKCFFVMGTAANSGKSIFGSLIQGMFPSKLVGNVSVKDLENTFGLGPLFGKAINVSLDLNSPNWSPNAVARLKNITGNDMITVNEKFVKMEKYKCPAKFVYASNHPVTLKEDDSAFWDRLIYIPFNCSVPRDGQNKSLLKELLKEKDQIASYVIPYGKKLIQNNYIFTTHEIVEVTIREWRNIQTDYVSEFINQNCQITGNRDDQILNEKLYETYEIFCKNKGVFIINQKSFIRRVHDLYPEINRCRIRQNNNLNPQHGLQGIVLKDANRYLVNIIRNPRRT